MDHYNNNNITLLTTDNNNNNSNNSGEEQSNNNNNTLVDVHPITLFVQQQQHHRLSNNNLNNSEGDLSHPNTNTTTGEDLYTTDLEVEHQPSTTSTFSEPEEIELVKVVATTNTMDAPLHHHHLSSMTTNLKSISIHHNNSNSKDATTTTTTTKAVTGATPIADTLTTSISSSPFIIKLNVGGVRYATTKDTLLNSESTFFKALLCGSCGNAMDGDGSYFIDRDGNLFEPILSFMRTGDFSPILYDSTTLSRIYREADFYGIKLLSDILSPQSRNGNSFLISRIDSVNWLSNKQSNNYVTHVISRANILIVAYRDLSIECWLYKGLVFGWMHIFKVESPNEIISLKLSLTKTKSNTVHKGTLLVTTDKKVIILYKFDIDPYELKVKLKDNIIKLNHVAHYSNFMVNGHYLALISRSGLISMLDCESENDQLTLMQIPFTITNVTDIEYVLFISCDNGKIYEMRQNMRDWVWDIEEVFEINSTEFLYPNYGGFSRKAWEMSTRKDILKNSILKVIETPLSNGAPSTSSSSSNTTTLPSTPTTPSPTSTNNRELLKSSREYINNQNNELFIQNLYQQYHNYINSQKYRSPHNQQNNHHHQQQQHQNNNNNNNHRQPLPSHPIDIEIEQEKKNNLENIDNDDLSNYFENAKVYVTCTSASSIQQINFESRYAFVAGTLDGHVHLMFRGSKYPDFQPASKFWIGDNDPIVHVNVSGGYEGIFVTAQSYTGTIKTWQYKPSTVPYPSNVKCISTHHPHRSSISTVSSPISMITRFKTYTSLFCITRYNPNQGGDAGSMANGNGGVGDTSPLGSSPTMMGLGGTLRGPTHNAAASLMNGGSLNHNLLNSLKTNNMMMNGSSSPSSVGGGGLSLNGNGNNSNVSGGNSSGNNSKTANSSYNQIYITGGDSNTGYELLIYPLSHRYDGDIIPSSEWLNLHLQKPIRIPMVDPSPISNIVVSTYGGSEPTYSDVAYQLITIHESNNIYSWDLRDIDLKFFDTK